MLYDGIASLNKLVKLNQSQIEKLLLYPPLVLKGLSHSGIYLFSWVIKYETKQQPKTQISCNWENFIQ